MSQTLGLVIFFFLSVVRSGKDKKIDLCAGASLGGLAIGDMGQPRENGLAGKKAAMVVSPLGPLCENEWEGKHSQSQVPSLRT